MRRGQSPSQKEPTRRGLPFVMLCHKTRIKRGQPDSLVALGGKEPTNGQPLVVSKGKDEEGEPPCCVALKGTNEEGPTPLRCVVLKGKDEAGKPLRCVILKETCWGLHSLSSQKRCDEGTTSSLWCLYNLGLE